MDKRYILILIIIIICFINLSIIVNTSDEVGSAILNSGAQNLLWSLIILFSIDKSLVIVFSPRLIICKSCYYIKNFFAKKLTKGDSILFYSISDYIEF